MLFACVRACGQGGQGAGWGGKGGKGGKGSLGGGLGGFGGFIFMIWSCDVVSLYEDIGIQVKRKGRREGEKGESF